MSGDNCCCLSASRFGFALALIGGLATLLLGWAGWWWGWGVLYTRVLSSAYIGLAPTFLGGIYGFIWAFVELFILGALIAWVYNLCLNK